MQLSDFTASGCFNDHGFVPAIFIWPSGSLLSRWPCSEDFGNFSQHNCDGGIRREDHKKKSSIFDFRSGCAPFYAQISSSKLHLRSEGRFDGADAAVQLAPSEP